MASHLGQTITNHVTLELVGGINGGFGNEPVVLIEFDFESDTIRRLGMPEAHSHSR